MSTEHSSQYKPYAGIGSRETPDRVLHLMTRIATYLAKKGYTLRSGHADGADTAFEEGAVLKEIYLPWPGFNHSASVLNSPTPAAYALAQRYHPAYNRLFKKGKALMARNGYQVLGETLDSPSLFLLCWTSDGCETKKTRTFRTGGTGQAIAIASDNNIPIFNLQRPTAFPQFKHFLKNNEALYVH